MIKDGRYTDGFRGPTPITDWTTEEEVCVRASRYESQRRAKLEELELIDALLSSLRSECVRRGFARDDDGFWTEKPR